MNNLLLAICLVLLTVSCREKSKVNNHYKNDAVVVDSQTNTQYKDEGTPSAREEKFDEFLNQFNKDFKIGRAHV